MFKNYFKTTIRNIQRNKTYSFLNIFGLAIGIACAGLIFLWVENEMSFDEVNVKKDRLYRVNINMSYDGQLYTMGSTPRPMAASLRNDISGVISTARVSDQDQRALFTLDDRSLYSSGRYVDASLFSMFTLSFTQGNANQPFPQLYSLVITERTAKKFFGNEKNVVGKTVRVDNKQDYIVSGVVKDLPENSTLQFEWLASFDISLQNREDDAVNWGSYGPYTYVELDAGADPAAINKQLQNFIRQKRSDQDKQAFLFPMSDWRLFNEFENGKQTGGGGIKQVRILSLIAWIILLIACINFMNLATANSQKRSKEVGVRKILGAGKKWLVIQFIGEALFMSLIAAIVAILLIAIALPAFNLLMQKELSMDLGDPVHLLALLTITVICGLVAGSYPSLYLSSFNSLFVIKGVRLKTGSAAVIRKGLVVFQFAVSVVFIISSLIVYRQIQHVKNRDLGFNKDNLIEIKMQGDIAGAFSGIRQDLLNTGLVKSAAISSSTTLYGGNIDNRFRWEGKAEDNQVSIAFRNVTPAFIATSGMQVLEGRDFGENAHTEGSNVIITQSLAKIMGEGSAVGKIIQSPRGNKEGIYTNLTVVGVVKDFVYGDIYGQSPGPVLYFCRPPENSNLLYVRLNLHGKTDQALAGIEAVMKKYSPAYPLEYKFVDDQFNAMFKNELQVGRVSGIFAALAIIISCLGLFGLAAYTAERRVKEIGVRKVLGASVAGITSLLSRDFLKLVFISCTIAFPVAWWMMNNWLQTYQYRIGVSWWIFFAAGFIAMFIALVTVSFQAVKAGMANPVKSLRTE